MQQTPGSCPDTDNPPAAAPPSLPAGARLSLNRCNLPAVILGSLTFQHHPAPLLLDGVHELHRRLFALLDDEGHPADRARLFVDYMSAHFLLDRPEEAGLGAGGRGKMDWRRLLRGWFFDAEGREAAVLKGWVESRFGLVTRFHGAPLQAAGDDGYLRYLEARSRGLYNTNALEAQLDLCYAFCQYELRRTHGEACHQVLYRGVNRLSDHEVLEQIGRTRYIMLLNNLSSFTSSRERADEFGDQVLSARVPLSKVFFHAALIPGLLQGESEHMVIGGVYEMERR